MADLYKILGVSKNAGESEIKRAYRKAARRYHPDLNPNDKAAEIKFKEINEAYEVLSSDENREKYDRYGDDWRHADKVGSSYRHSRGPFFTGQSSGRRSGGGGFDNPFGDLGDLFAARGARFSHGSESVNTARVDGNVTVTLEEAFAGTKRNITVTQNRRDRRLEVTIPSGVRTGSVVRVSPGQGQEIRLKVKVESHPVFKRIGNDLEVEVPISWEDAILGGEIDVKTISGNVKLKVPEESQNGQKIRLSGRGMPKLGSKDVKGDFFVVLRPQLPQGLTKEQRDLIEQFRNSSLEEG